MPLRYVPIGLAVVLAAVCIGLFTWTLAVYTVDVPVLDDFTKMFEFPLVYEKLRTTADKIKFLLARDGLMEHRIGTMRGLVLLQYKLLGEVDFYALSWIGNAFVYVLAGFLLVVFAQTRRPYWYYLPLLFLVFQPQLLPFGILWCNSTLLYVPVSLASLAGFYLLIDPPAKRLSDRPVRFVAALVLIVLGLYTFSNGLFVLPIAPLLLAAQRRWRHAAVLIFYEVVLTAAYLTDYHKSDATHPPSPALAGAYVHTFFAFVGGLLDFGTPAHRGVHLLIPIAAGVGITILFGLIFLRTLGTVWPAARRLPSRWSLLRPTDDERTYRFDLFLVSTFLYLFLTALALTLFRITDANDTETLFRSRYKINNVLFMVAAYGSILSLWPRAGRAVGWLRYVAAGGIVGTFALFAYSYYWTAQPVQYDRDRYNHAAFNYRYNGWWGMHPEVMWFELYAKRLSDVVIPRHLYRFPNFYYSPFEGLIRHGAGTRSGEPVNVTESAASFVVTNPTIGAVRGGRDGQCLVLRSSQRTYLFAVQPRLNGRWAWLGTGRVFGPGFTSYVPKPILAAGTYRVGLFRYVGGKPSLTWLPATITDR